MELNSSSLYPCRVNCGCGCVGVVWWLLFRELLRDSRDALNTACSLLTFVLQRPIGKGGIFLPLPFVVQCQFEANNSVLHL